MWVACQLFANNWMGDARAHPRLPHVGLFLSPVTPILHIKVSVINIIDYKILYSMKWKMKKLINELDLLCSYKKFPVFLISNTSGILLASSSRNVNLASGVIWGITLRLSSHGATANLTPFWCINSLLVIHGSRLVAHGLRLTAYGSRLTDHGSRLPGEQFWTAYFVLDRSNT